MSLDTHYGSAYIIAHDPYGELSGGLSDIARWYYRRQRGNWRVSVDVPNITNGKPYDGAMSGNAVCDDFGILRIVGVLS